MFADYSDLDEVSTALTEHFTGRYARASSTGLSSNYGRRARTILVLAAIMLALVFGLIFYSQWDTLLRFWWSQPYGVLDPIFDRDIGFYLFELPFLELIQNYLLWASLLASGLLFLGYSYGRRVRIHWRQGIEAQAKVLWHLAVNLFLFLLVSVRGLYESDESVIRRPLLKS